MTLEQILHIASKKIEKLSSQKTGKFQTYINSSKPISIPPQANALQIKKGKIMFKQIEGKFPEKTYLIPEDSAKLEVEYTEKQRNGGETRDYEKIIFYGKRGNNLKEINCSI